MRSALTWFGAAAPGPDASADEVVAGSAVYYAFLKAAHRAGEMAIKRLADLLKDNRETPRHRAHRHRRIQRRQDHPRYRELGYKRAGEVVKKLVSLASLRTGLLWTGGRRSGKHPRLGHQPCEEPPRCIRIAK